MTEGRFVFGKFCTECDAPTEEQILEDTGETFGPGFHGHTVYKCPSCGQAYKVRRAYYLTPKDVGDSS